jgi:hypothetical protein
MASQLPFTARRARRCAMGTACPHGGRIRPGDVAIHTAPHVWFHAGEPSLILDAIQYLVAQPAFTEQLFGALRAIADMARAQAETLAILQKGPNP